jgi:hypothetical protein
MNLFFFSLLNFTRNYIKVRFFFFLLLFVFFSHYICFFILFLNFSILNNCMNVVVGFYFHMRSIFSWFIYRIFKFLAIATSFFSYEIFFSWFIYLLLFFFCVIYLLQIYLCWFSFFFPSNSVLSIMECWFILI